MAMIGQSRSMETAVPETRPEVSSDSAPADQTSHPGMLAPRDWQSHPPYLVPDYKSTTKRAPRQPLILVEDRLRMHFNLQRSPVFGASELQPLDNDLTANARCNGEPLGERIIVAGRVTDPHGRAVAHSLVEIWQANAAGRYVHKVDQHDAPLDPNFLGAGRTLTDDQGWYRFKTIKPGAYPWGNHPNAWRPNHIHFSLFGDFWDSRLVTQMYFPGDPLLALDPIFLGTPVQARERLMAEFDLTLTEPGYALGYRFDIVLRGAL